MTLVALESSFSYLSMYMKNVQIGYGTHLVHQFKDKVILDPEIDSKSDSIILN
jgi:hypothetical protein